MFSISRGARYRPQDSIILLTGMPLKWYSHFPETPTVVLIDPNHTHIPSKSQYEAQP